MALEFMRATLEGLPEELRSCYARDDDGRFRLLVEGLPDVSGLKANQTRLIAEKRALRDKLAEYQAREAQGRDEARPAEAEDSPRLAEALARLEAAAVENQRLRDTLGAAALDRELMAEVTRLAAPRPEALVDILARGRNRWRLDENGRPAPVGPGPEGDGQELPTVADWARQLVREAAHLFAPSPGGGARGSTPGGRAGLSAEELARMNPTEKAAWARERGPFPRA